MIPAPLLARVLRNGAKGRGKRNSTVSGSTTTTSNPSGKGSAGPWLMRIKRSKVYFTAAASTSEPSLNCCPERNLNVQTKLSRSEEHTSELQSRGHLVC